MKLTNLSLSWIPLSKQLWVQNPTKTTPIDQKLFDTKPGLGLWCYVFLELPWT